MSNMSLLSLTSQISYCADPHIRNALLHVIQSMDLDKFTKRTQFCLQFSDNETKIPLLEYYHAKTSSELVPNTDVILHAVFKNPEFTNRLSHILVGSSKKIKIYTRQKIDHKQGKPVPDMRQLVLHIKPYAFDVPDIEYDDLSPIEHLD